MIWVAGYCIVTLLCGLMAGELEVRSQRHGASLVGPGEVFLLVVWPIAVPLALVYLLLVTRRA